MGDFSQNSDVYKKNIQVDLASALRESISFGRFLSESLDWEKWSSFNHNKHLEEAKNCSVPGSVAEKKAYFEAHYKKSAFLKLAAEEEPLVKNDKEPKNDISSCIKDESEEHKNQVDLKTPCKFGDNHGFEKMDVNEFSPVKGIGFHGNQSLQIMSSNKIQNNEGETIAIDSVCKKQGKKEISTTSHLNEGQNKKKSITCTIKPVEIHEGSRILSSSALKKEKSMLKENKTPQNRMENSLRSIDSNSIPRGQKSSLVNKISSFYVKVGDSKADCTSSRSPELHHIRMKTPSKVSTNGPKHVFSMPEIEYKGTQVPLYEASSAKRKVDAKFYPLSVNCFKFSSARENRQIVDSSVSSSFKTVGKVRVRSRLSKVVERAIESRVSGSL